MTMASIIQTVFALIFVLSLIVITTMLLKKLNLIRYIAGQPGTRRIGIQDTVMLDHKRRLVLIRRDNIEHLILLSASGETVIESNIKSDIKDNQLQSA